MNTCRPECIGAMTQPDWATGCDTTPKKGGISRLLFFVCDDTYVLPEPDKGWNSLVNIQQAICDNKLFFSAPLLAQKPKGSFTKRRLSSCSPEKVISGTKTITFTDSTNTGTAQLEYDFWDDIDKKQAFLLVGWVTCDDRLYIVNGAFDLEIDEVIEPTSDEISMFDGTITFQDKNLQLPYSLAGLNAIFDSYAPSTCYGSQGQQ